MISKEGLQPFGLPILTFFSFKELKAFIRIMENIFKRIDLDITGDYDMKVFLCWSGKRSKQTAEKFKEWLPQLIQAIEPWMSPDIERGTSWSSEIADQIEKSKVGIICLTKENLDNRWILFESGALSKTRDARPCTFLLDITPVAIEQPLAQFQHTQLKEEDMWKLLLTINKRIEQAGENAPSEKVLSNLFKALWPKFKEELQKIASQQQQTSRPDRTRTQSEILEEILGLVRAQGRQIEQIARVIKMREILKDINKNGSKDKIEKLAEEIPLLPKQEAILVLKRSFVYGEIDRKTYEELMTLVESDNRY